MNVIQKSLLIGASAGVLGALAATTPTQHVDASSLTSTSYNQVNHYTIPQGFMNDIQTIFKGSDGYYHVYYLSNDRYRQNNDGTSWYHVKTKDFVHFENVGVAIPKFTDGWEAMATGSVVKNDNGFYKDLPKTAIVAYFTSYTPTGQHQYAAYSLDNGKTYKAYGDKQPIMRAAASNTDNRDPYVTYNSQTKKMMMYLAEGDKIGTYSSTDGKSFKYEGATILNKFSLEGKDLGLVECPNLKTIKNSTTGETKQVMFFGANGYNYGQTTGTYYMVGHLDSKGVFVAEQQPKRVDQGTDFYGANFYQQSENVITSIGWLGNWGYTAGDIKDADGTQSLHLGSFTNTKSLTLSGTSGNYKLSSSDILSRVYSKLSNSVTYTGNTRTAKKSDGWNSDLLSQNRWTSQYMEFNFKGNDNKAITGHIQLQFNQNDSKVSVDYNADNGQYEVTRSSTKLSGDAANNFNRSYVEDSGVVNPKSLKIQFTADKNSLEMELNGQTYTLAKYSTDGNMNVQVKASGDVNLVSNMANIESSPK